jgi:transposase
MRNIVDSLADQFEIEIKSRGLEGENPQIYSRWEKYGDVQYIGELRLGWENHDHYRIRRTVENVMAVITNPVSKEDGFLTAFFQPDDQKIQHPISMRKFVRASSVPEGVMFLRSGVEKQLIREQILLHFIRWRWNIKDELSNFLCSELYMPHKYLAKLDDHTCIESLRLRVAQKLIMHWIDPSKDFRSYPAFKKFCIEQVLREDPDLLSPSVQFKEKNSKSREAHNDIEIALAPDIWGKQKVSSEADDDSENGMAIKEHKSWATKLLDARIDQEGLSILEISKRTGVTLKSIYKWIRDGKLKTAQKAHSKRILASDLPKVMELAQNARRRAETCGNLQPIIKFISERDGLKELSARRKYQLWKKTEKGRERLRQIAGEISKRATK